MYAGDLLLESRIPETVKSNLEKRGHQVTMRGPWPMNHSAGIVADWKNGTVSAAADPRTTASGLAWPSARRSPASAIWNLSAILT
jgi:gamma-glutamyltranspeptidase